ncbi:MAG: ribonucleoside-diphosphate reductase, adenosylcobalamin-dependent [Candidatus Wallbacteria bacterium GWC2_49_35]|uniref:Vitamin B12-dependent ribonucleotide reductase n=1 Tax=Candidatus Wallbacteria bacterium GWC2_49_35 TaxID=1817813 RepID=A0A1F7WKI1_9BACT|nr:MAG: ribonucleoside-diphosphate reductase, adenosylcobalamin-dependent [Candidatus Wallbacteria bacterium GWC2_49_35]
MNNTMKRTLTDKKIELTPNARIVLEKRYLKPNETPEKLLWRVAKNVALGDVIYDRNIGLNAVYKNVSRAVVEPGDERSTELTLLYNPGYENADKLKMTLGQFAASLPEESLNSPETKKTIDAFRDFLSANGVKNYDDNFRQFLDNLNELYDSCESARRSADEFFDVMASLEFLPNSPTLMNAGNTLQQLSACFVLPVEDDIKGIYSTLLDAAMIHKSGGGTGFSFSRLRPRNDNVKTTKGIASGPISFMRVYNASTEEIKQGGTRRGANMGILRVDHPDIIDFITCKKDDKTLTNFNISVAITDKFMQAVADGADFDLVNPHSGEVVKTVMASQIWNLLVENAWRNGDPGVIFIDRINEYNPTPALGDIESTNPCGEQPLLPYESCNLGSINLGRMIKNGKVNYDRLAKVVACAVHFLDNIIDMNKYPSAEIERLTRSNRKIGLGIMGFADMLAQLEIAYNSDAACDLAENIMNFIRTEARKASAALAAVRGVFPNFKNSIYDLNSPNFKGDDIKLRNAASTTVAPTGTISTIAGAWGGIEPYFALSYEKRVMDGTVLREINPFLIAALKKHGLLRDDIIETIKTDGTLKNLSELPENLRDVFVTSHEIPYEWHVKIQAAFQKYCDNAVSKTINFSNSATAADIAQAYMMAYKMMLKGITVYRDGCKSEQVYHTGSAAKTSTGADKNAPASAACEIPKLPQAKKRKTPQIADGTRIRKDTGCGMLYVHIYKDLDGKEIEVFADLGKAGGCPSAFTEGLGRLSSLALKHGATMQEIRDELIEIKCTKEKGLGPNYIASCLDGVGKAIHDYISLREMARQQAAEKDGREKTTEPNNSDDSNFTGGVAQALSISGSALNGNSYLGGVTGPNHGQSGACPECGGTLDYVEGCRGGKCRNPACSYYSCG